VSRPEPRTIDRARARPTPFKFWRGLAGCNLTEIAALRIGINGPEITHIPRSLAAKLPPEFKKLGLETHRGFDQIALDAEQIGAADLTMKQLAGLMGNCLACHATWRLLDGSKR